jgi:serine/threonine protein kinase
MESNKKNSKNGKTNEKNIKFTNDNIKEWWNRVKVGKTSIGTGASSEAYMVADADKVYIVRITDITNYMTKLHIRHEMKIYERILADPTHTLYISNLLFAYCPPNLSVDKEAIFVFRYFMGAPLDRLLKFQRDKGFSINKESADRWEKQMKETLEFLKSVGVVHRDIKPANLYVDTEHNRLLLFDFESACFVGSDCLTTDFRGTREYAKENSKRLIGAMGFPVPYQYSHANDEHAIEVMFTTDIIPYIRE